LVSRDLEVALHGFDVISVVNDHVLDRIKVDGQGVLVVESDFDMLTSDQILVMGVNFVSDEMVEMRYQYKEEFVEESGRTNVVIAAYTTAQVGSLSEFSPKAIQHQFG
jgi:hypothetical protein